MPNNTASPKDASQAWEALFRAQVSVMRRFEEDNLMPGLTLKEYDVLYALKTAGRPLRLKELNEYVLLHQSALSRMVERLTHRGFVSTSAAPEDKRGTDIALTELGLTTQKQMGRKHTDQIMHYVGQALTPEELQTLTRITQKLKNAQPSIPAYTTTLKETK